MKRILLAAAALLLLTGCSSNNEFPYIRYQHESFNFGRYNKTIDIPDGYILNQGYSYDIVETEDGYDLVLHFIKEN